MALNLGKQQVGTVGAPNYISYGNQSPASDAVALTWVAGDFRFYMGTDLTIIGWRCTVAGTPGTWVQVNNTV